MAALQAKKTCASPGAIRSTGIGVAAGDDEAAGLKAKYQARSAG